MLDKFLLLLRSHQWRVFDNNHTRYVVKLILKYKEKKNYEGSLGAGYQQKTIMIMNQCIAMAKKVFY